MHVWLIIAALAASEPSVYRVLVVGETAAVVRRTLDGARVRLTARGCQLIFEDLVGRNGLPLADEVATTGKSPSLLLADLHFADGDDTVQCRTDEGLAVFTALGSHVVHVCSKRFVRLAAKPERAEMLLIHELLHTLGLGERRPTSAYITSVVTRRCRD
jgi:hypothetical protein